MTPGDPVLLKQLTELDFLQHDELKHQNFNFSPFSSSDCLKIYFAATERYKIQHGRGGFLNQAH